MRLITLSPLLTLLITLLECDARSTRVTAQYTVADDTDSSQRTFRGKGIVEDASLDSDDGILTKYNTRPARNPPRVYKKRVQQHQPPTSQDYDQISFNSDQLSEKFAVKGKVFDRETSIPTRSAGKTRPSPQHSKQNIGKAKVQQVPLQSQQFRFPSIKNEEVFETKFQEAPTTLHTRKYKPESSDSSQYTYSTIKFSDSDEQPNPKKLKGKPPKRSTATFNLEQSFGGQQTKFDTIIDHSDVKFDSDGFKPSTQFAFPTTVKTPKKQKYPTKLFKSPEDEFKDSEFYDFSHRPRPGASGPSGKFEKFSSDLGVKTLAIKPHKNKFDPPHIQNGGFKPSFKLKDFPTLHGSDIGQGVASPGQITKFYDASDSDRDERYKIKLSSDSSPASKAQFAQFLKAKEDERLEKIVEEQFKLQQQKQLQQEKEAELKHQQILLQRQKEKIKQAEKNLSSKAQQSSRQKRRPSPHSKRQQRNPSSVGFSVTGAGKGPVPMRTVKGKDGSYRVSFSV